MHAKPSISVLTCVDSTAWARPPRVRRNKGNVFNISSMTRNQAKLLAHSNDGSLCVRIHVSKEVIGQCICIHLPLGEASNSFNWMNRHGTTTSLPKLRSTSKWTWCILWQVSLSKTQEESRWSRSLVATKTSSISISSPLTIRCYGHCSNRVCRYAELGARWIAAFNPDTIILLFRNRVLLLFLD